MEWIKDLKNKILDSSAVIGIMGLGYVGLPLAVEFSKKYKVIGYNKDESKIKFLLENKSYIEDVADDEINLERFYPTANYNDLEKCNIIIIAVPTPLRDDKSPDLSYIKDAAEMAGTILKRGQFIILKSTTYPGTTEEYLIPILEESSGLTSVVDFGVAYSPERVDPGNKKYNIKNTPNVVGGLTPEFTDICANLYEGLTNEIVKVKDCKTAEAVKMIENIFRNVNIALMNELSLIFEEMEINIWDAVDAAKTKPYGFMPFYPGPGVGGHCIPLDPYYLSYRAKQFGIIPRFIETAGEINDYMPVHTVNLTQKILIKSGKKIRGSKVLVMGLAYKGDISDTRESPSVKIIEEFKERGAKIEVYDPYVKGVKTRFGSFQSGNLDKKIKWAECVVLVTDHKVFSNNLNLKMKFKESNIIIVDTRNVFKSHDFDDKSYIKL